MTQLLTPTVRARIYSTLVALGALGVAYDLIAPDRVDAWLALASAILLAAGNGLALAHTPRGRHAAGRGGEVRDARDARGTAEAGAETAAKPQEAAPPAP